MTPASYGTAARGDGGATAALALALDPTGRPTVALRRQDGASGAISVVLHALDADGAPRWERALAAGWGPVASGAAGTVRLLDGPTLHALDGATGATLWTATDPEGRQGWSLAVDDAGAAVVAGPGPFVQRYATDGTPAGGRTFGSARQDTLSALAWSGGVVVGGATEGPLARAVDPEGRVEAYVLRFPAGAP